MTGPLDNHRHERREAASARRFVRDLRGLAATAAPPDLAASVLARVGLGDAYWRQETPLGPVFIAYNDHGIRDVSRVADAGDAAGYERALQARTGRPARPVTCPPAALARAVERHLAGDRRAGLRFDLRGLSEFGRAVLLKALEIPRGEVRPYGWIAREIGRPRAVRAVGTALGGNPIPLLIPCHRVVRGDGHVGEYALGAAAKRAVLAAEGLEPDRLDGLASAGVRYYGSDTTRIYCFPTCRHNRRVTDRHRVTFRSEREAAAAGYRPCRVCRPALAS